MCCDVETEMYEFAGRMCRKYHALIVADFDVNTNMFTIFVKHPGDEKYIKIPVSPHEVMSRDLEQDVRQALDQLKGEN